MSKSHVALLTREGLEELNKEYKLLIQDKRPDLVTRIATAREAGDLTENSEYAAAREDLAFVDGRIAEIETILNGAQTIKHPNPGKVPHVDLGCKVHLVVKGKNMVFTIVGEWEADPTQQRISHESPLGRALMGKRIGESVEVQAPAGKVIYTVTKIE